MAGMSVLREQIEGFCFGCGEAGTRKAEPAEARSAFGFQGLTVPGSRRTPVAAKASAERRSVPRLPGSCRPARTRISGAGGAEDIVCREVRRVDEGGDALGLLGGDGAREDIGGQEEMFGVVAELRMARLVAFAQEDGGEAQMAAQGFGDEVLAFDGDEPEGVRPVGRGRRAAL